jgi:hypothetical protein
VFSPDSCLTSANDERFDEKQSTGKENPAVRESIFFLFQSEKEEKKPGRGYREEELFLSVPPSPTRISNQARRPAEFKHIIKRRKRN